MSDYQASSKKNLLLLLTYMYPYAPPVEQFLDAEIQYLKESFDIIAVPIARNIDLDKSYDSLNSIKSQKIKRASKSSELLLGSVGILKRIKSFISDINILSQTTDSQYRKSAIINTIKIYAQSYVLKEELVSQLDIKEYEKYDNIILYSYWLGSQSVALILYKEYLKKKFHKKRINVISRAHGDGDLFIEGLDSYRPNAQLMNSKISKIFSISNAGMILLRNQGIMNTIISRLGVTQNNSIEFDKHNNIPIIVSCSVINENKQVDLIAKAISRVSFKVKWVHFGGGNLEIQLKEWCANNMPDNIKWEIKGWTEHEQITHYYMLHKPDLFINLSKMEGIPVSIMEAFSYGIPALASDVGGTSEIIDDGVNGFLLKKNYKINEVSELIEYYLKMEDSAKARMKLASYKKWDSDYNALTNYAKFSSDVLEIAETEL